MACFPNSPTHPKLNDIGFTIQKHRARSSADSIKFWRTVLFAVSLFGNLLSSCSLFFCSACHPSLTFRYLPQFYLINFIFFYAEACNFIAMKCETMENYTYFSNLYPFHCSLFIVKYFYATIYSIDFINTRQTIWREQI